MNVPRSGRKASGTEFSVAIVLNMRASISGGRVFTGANALRIAPIDRETDNTLDSK